MGGNGLRPGGNLGFSTLPGDFWDDVGLRVEDVGMYLRRGGMGTM